VGLFGIHCWGWNLCPGATREPALHARVYREMSLTFYPNADGLFLESSDYAICHHCGPKHFEHEFSYVRRISDEVWRRNPQATVVVYPHYFTGAKLPFAMGEERSSPWTRVGLCFSRRTARTSTATSSLRPGQLVLE